MPARDAGYCGGMQMPPPRGTLSQRVRDALADSSTRPLASRPAPAADDHADAMLSLWMLHELHYRGFDGVDERLEWDPALLGLRRRLEDDLEQDLRARFARSGVRAESAEEIFRIAEEHEGPSLASYVHRHATREQVLELLKARSVYHLKESDPVSWVIPRLGPVAKAALMELQYDEYGGGDPRRLHAHLFALGLEACGLDAEYGAYLPETPTEVLEQNNVMSLFGLHRRLRGAALGHLAAFEATSSLPSRRLAQGMDRLDMPAEIQHYYREHVEADAVHEQLAVRTICGALLAESPGLLDDVILGAWTCLDQEDRIAQHFWDRWGLAAAPSSAGAA
ncbi:iron-containing redox enzyme family protein [Nocardioides campestrisoli]|uniref:iron-containing redox enzyme family protein n=1 Tax=Nocardioides campestrisoli TaxID=2736757 RepID=UPI002159D23C|nr:iron-containing redox enzyme family protein [Nocardioides campestrisoli]